MFWKIIFFLYSIVALLEDFQLWSLFFPTMPVEPTTTAYQATSVFYGIMLVPRLLALYSYAFNKSLLKYGFLWGIILVLELISIANIHTWEILRGLFSQLELYSNGFLDTDGLLRLLLHTPIVYTSLRLTTRRSFFPNVSTRRAC